MTQDPRLRPRTHDQSHGGEFIEKAGMGTAIAGVWRRRAIGLGADPLGIPIGSQTYPERQMVADGKFVELLKNMHGAGIRQIELCSPGYAQFKSLADGKQTRKIIEDAGLKCVSSHFSFNEFRTSICRRRSSGRRTIGMTQIGTASLGGGVRQRRDSRQNQVQYARRASTTRSAPR